MDRLHSWKISNAMKKTKIHPSTLSLFLAIIVIFTFAGRAISSIPGRLDVRTNTGNDPITEDIAKIELQFKQSFITGDTALFLKCYAPDACILPPNAPLLRGPALLQFFKGAYRSGVRDATFNSLGLFGQTAEYVTQQGAVEIFDGAQHSLGKAKVLMVWKKTGEGWKIFRHMINFDAPLPSPAAN